MNSGKVRESEPSGDEFTIHVLNNYTDSGLSVLVDHLNLDAGQLGAVIHAEHRNVVAQLSALGIKYAQLGNALVPKAGRYEVAFIFDSTQAKHGLYGYSLAEEWIPILKSHGPDKTAIRIGDILELPSEFVWEQFEQHLVGPAVFPRIHANLYFTVYLTNLSPTQVTNIDEALTTATSAYLGYVDCSTFKPLKLGLYLPQVGIRLRSTIITGADDQGTPNLPGYPYEDSGFEVVGVPEELYGPFLGHRLDNGITAWADQDSAYALTVLGGHLRPLTATTIEIDDNRLDYFNRAHGASLTRAGLATLGKNELTNAIEERLTNGLIYNLRFKEGSRNGVLDSALDALLYSVQLEFADAAGDAKRYQVGLKYRPTDHASEVVTFF